MGLSEIRWAYTEARVPTDPTGKRNPACLAVLKCLAEHISNGGSAYCSVETVAQETGLGESTVRKALQRLRDAMCIKEVVAPAGYRTRAYVLLITAAAPLPGSALPLPGSAALLPAGPKRTTKEVQEIEVLRTSSDQGTCPEDRQGGVTPDPAFADDSQPKRKARRGEDPDDPGTGDPLAEAGPVRAKGSPQGRLSVRFYDALKQIAPMMPHNHREAAGAFAALMARHGISEPVMQRMIDIYFANPDDVRKLDGRRPAYKHFLYRRKFLYDKAVAVSNNDRDYSIPDEIAAMQDAWLERARNE